MSTTTPIVAIRPATADDLADVVRLARLDSARVPAGRLLLGVVDGRLRAAVAIDSGVAIADPFVPTADVVALLSLRAARLRGELAGGRVDRVRALLTGRRRVTSTA